jgi:hypothetical protein
VRSRLRIPFLGAAIALLVCGVWGGLLRIGWQLPQARTDLVVWHGPLMVFGFLGTVISLERAVALRRGWGYLAPAATIVGIVLLLGASSPRAAQLALLLAGALLLGLFVVIVRGQPNAANLTLALGAVMWIVGVALWLAGESLADVVPWWAGFLVTTIVGERLELAALGRLTSRGKIAFGGLIGLLVVGLAVRSEQATGLSFIGLALWLLRFDIARRTIRLRGLPRFVASSLLPGYVWLGVAGALWIGHGTAVAGPLRDAELHAVFLGFVFSMIFGHAPVIFPAVLGVKIPFRRVFYVHLVVLHVGLVLRVVGDAAGSSAAARDGALVSALAMALFFVVTVGSAALAAWPPAAVRLRRERHA